jgi:hypothetical protein
LQAIRAAFFKKLAGEWIRVMGAGHAAASSSASAGASTRSRKRKHDSAAADRATAEEREIAALWTSVSIKRERLTQIIQQCEEALVAGERGAERAQLSAAELRRLPGMNVDLGEPDALAVLPRTEADMVSSLSRISRTMADSDITERLTVIRSEVQKRRVESASGLEHNAREQATRLHRTRDASSRQSAANMRI